jgi:hypothetical protein
MDDWGDDKNGRPISWTTGVNRILDMYGRNTMTKQEAIAKYHDVLWDEDAAEYLDQERESDDEVARGEDPELCPQMTWHSGQGHQGRYLTKDGPRTIVQRLGQSSNGLRQSSIYNQDPRYDD